MDARFSEETDVLGLTRSFLSKEKQYIFKQRGSISVPAHFGSIGWNTFDDYSEDIFHWLARSKEEVNHSVAKFCGRSIRRSKLFIVKALASPVIARLAFFENHRIYNITRDDPEYLERRMSALAGPDEQMVIPDKSGYRILLMLAFFQHFGLPTPLLDWTSSPLVALFMSLFERPQTAKDVSIYRLDPSLLPTEVTFQQYDKLISFRRIQQQVGGVLFFGSCKDSRIDIDPTIYSEYAQNIAHKRFIQKLNISIGPGDIEKIQGALKNNGFREDMVFPNSMQYVSKQIREKILQYGI
jgi:hypothetical protein